MPVTNVESALAEKFARLLPHLNERQRRLTVAAEAATLGRGGVSVAARASGLSRPTVYRGLVELDEPAFDAGRARAELDPNRYPQGVKVADQELAALRIKHHTFHGEWNYTVHNQQRAQHTKCKGYFGTRPKILVPPPCGFGISTARTGGGK